MNYDDDLALQPVAIPVDILRAKTLWLAVFRQGLIDFALERAGRGQGVEASAWFHNDHNDGPGSFIWCCDLFGIDPIKARAGVLANWRQLVRAEYHTSETL